MNRWTARHRDALEQDLQPEERLLDATRVVVTAASSIALVDADAAALATAEPDRNRLLLGSRSDRMRHRAARGRGSRAARVAVARDLGFPIPGPILVLGVTDQRAVFWRASQGMASPRELAGSFPLDEVAASVGRPVESAPAFTALDAAD